MKQEEFYEQVARLLGTKHEAAKIRESQERPTHDGLVRNNYRNRWNNRDPGNGRYPGRGIVRHYGSCVHVALHNPPLSGIYASVDDALKAIEIATNIKPRIKDYVSQNVFDGIRILTPEEVERYRQMTRKAYAAAKAVVQKAGVTVDPQIAARKAKPENES